MALDISAFSETWPLKNSFSISRGSKSSVDVVIVKIEDGASTGYGEAVPYRRYDQDVKGTLDTIQQIARENANRLSHDILRQQYPPSAARNALDCALWDLEAKQADTPVWKLVDLPAPAPLIGAYSLSLEPPEQLAENARDFSSFPLLKIKLGKEQVVESVAAVRETCPRTRIIIDANEAWDIDLLQRVLPDLKMLAVELIEQPLPAAADSMLEEIDCIVPLCADESFHCLEDLERLADRYDYFNIKLDKTGGLSTALELTKRVKAIGKQIMVGSMMSTSLGLAPAMLLAYDAAFVDLDSSMWLAEDRPYGIRFENGILHPANRRLWG